MTCRHAWIRFGSLDLVGAVVVAVLAPAIRASGAVGTALAIVLEVVPGIDLLLRRLPRARRVGSVIGFRRLDCYRLGRVKAQKVRGGERRHAMKRERPRCRREARGRRRCDTNRRGRRRRRRVLRKEVTGSTPEVVVDRRNGDEETVQIVQAIVDVLPNLVQPLPFRVCEGGVVELALKGVELAKKRVAKFSVHSGVVGDCLFPQGLIDPFWRA